MTHDPKLRENPLEGELRELFADFREKALAAADQCRMRGRRGEVRAEILFDERGSVADWSVEGTKAKRRADLKKTA